MAFMGRGGFSGIQSGNIGDGENDDGMRKTGYHRGFHYYVPLDNTYVIMQMAVTFIILIAGLITFIATYKSTIMDPIEGTKGLFINMYLIIIGIFLVVTLVTNFLSKSEIALIKRLVVILAISIITMLVFFGIKMNLDKTYTKDKFVQFYTEQNASSDNATKSKIDIGLTGMSIKTEKEYYVDECLKLYGIFSTKAYGTMRTSSFT